MRWTATVGARGGPVSKKRNEDVLFAKAGVASATAAGAESTRGSTERFKSRIPGAVTPEAASTEQHVCETGCSGSSWGQAGAA